MSASTTLCTAVASLTGPAEPTQASKSKAATQGTDYIGMASAASAALYQAKTILTQLQACTDVADPNAAVISNVLLSLT